MVNGLYYKLTRTTFIPLRIEQPRQDYVIWFLTNEDERSDLREFLCSELRKSAVAP